MRKLITFILSVLTISLCTSLAFAEEQSLQMQISYIKPTEYILEIPTNPLSINKKENGNKGVFNIGVNSGNCNVSIGIVSRNLSNASNSNQSFFLRSEEGGYEIPYTLSIDRNDPNNPTPFINGESWEFVPGQVNKVYLDIQDEGAVRDVMYYDVLRFVITPTA